MKLVGRCVHGLLVLFVDDGMTAAFVVGWIILACSLLRRLQVGMWSGPILFTGLAAIIAVSILPRRR